MSPAKLIREPGCVRGEAGCVSGRWCLLALAINLPASSTLQNALGAVFAFEPYLDTGFDASRALQGFPFARSTCSRSIRDHALTSP